MNIFKENKKSKKLFFILNTLFILSGMLQGISVILSIPFFKALFLAEYNNMWSWLLYIGISALLCFILHFIGINIGNRMSVWDVCDTQVRRLGYSITTLPLGWFDSSSKGKVSKAISNDINTISHYPSMVLPEILITSSSTIVIAISLLFISIKYAVIIMLMGISMTYFWKRHIKIQKKIEKEAVSANQKMESSILEFSQLQAVLRASGALVNDWEPLNKALKDDKDASLKSLKNKGQNTFAYMFIANLGSLIILIISALDLKNGSIQIYTFTGIFIAMMRFANPLAGLLPYGAEVFNIKSAIERINSIVNAKRLPETKKDIKIKDKSSNSFDIEFKNVDFSYIKNTKVLKNINLSIPSGKITALVGASGSGKSTINKLIARFWDVDSGEVLINNTNIKDIKSENLMNLISMVFQEVYLFNTTIKENIAIANPNATEEEILEAAKKARLDEVIERLPNGWNTNVGEGGSSLSGGEKQRVSIARAFLKDAPILLLDEITSALDGSNEAIITKSLEELSKNKTVIVIAHRLSSIKNADAIAVVDDGEIIAYGTHSELLASSEKYQKLWNALASGESWQIA